MSNEKPKAWEGPWIDEEGRQCQGIWANEGGVLLVLREEQGGEVSFHHAQINEDTVCSLTIEAFRLRRIKDFLTPEIRTALVPMRDLRK